MHGQSDSNLGADFNHPARWDLKVVGRVVGDRDIAINKWSCHRGIPDWTAQDQREHAEHNDAGDGLSLRGGGDRLAECIKRRGSVIPKDDADTSQRQDPKAGSGRLLGLCRRNAVRYG